jgi:methylmalonyl-CoA/ethylmalonyl-CoA epimerase
VGYVVRSIPTSIDRFITTLGMTWDEKIFYDPIQTVRVTFLEHRAAGQPMVELVEPASSDSQVARFANSGGGLHHLCYEVDDLEAELARVESLGSLVLQSPVPAVAFSGRRIAWICTRDRLLIEYLEYA